MLDFMFEFGARSESGDKRTYGVVVASVIDNLDVTGGARVQISVPFLPGFFPWARVASPMTGMLAGAFFIPQIGDEVLVAFHHGDIHEPYVIGSLWNMLDRPPSLAPTESITKRMIRTPLGQEVVFDDLLQSVSISNTTKQTVSLDPLQAQVAAGLGAASITLDTAGNVTIKGALSISLQAPTISIDGETVTVSASATGALTCGASCTIQGAVVNIN